ncbi:nucleotide disphospho-sugar-binding domain-containing protein [Phytohabitans rumicis]|uniref:Glycosyl transferase n=1 Tax=Phytohabitans rumicis TaxID=1076125 RepID=A0A6V8KXH8_9ACTN|nr:nucleotide disphospho-sugar-binding domain-containing protein [Phytohabitans rumicis]GFJ87131.1 glycosyl transferase [Phytohabitans rumicis]
MRVLVTPLAVHSHFFSMVPLLWACRVAGHEVLVASQPRLVGSAIGAGLPAVAVGRSGDFQTDAVDLMRRHMAGDPEVPSMAEPWIRTARTCAADLVDLGRSWRPDLVLTDPMAYAGPLVADALGVPLVRLLWGPDWPRFGFGFGGHPEGGHPERWPASLVELFESYGARTAVDFAVHTLDLFPPSLQVPGLANRTSVRFVPYSGPGTVPRWLARPPDRPRVCVTWGTNTTVYAGPQSFLVPEILAGLDGLDVELVLALSGPNLALSGPDRERLGDLPAGARLVEHLPLDLVLPSCAALVSQGGAGAMGTAAAHGVPHVVVPVMADQPTNAGLVAATGAGFALYDRPLDPADVRAAVTAAAFDPQPRAAATRLREEILALPTPAQTVPLLENLAAAGVSRPGGRDTGSATR